MNGFLLGIGSALVGLGALVAMIDTGEPLKLVGDTVIGAAILATVVIFTRFIREERESARIERAAFLQSLEQLSGKMEEMHGDLRVLVLAQDGSLRKLYLYWFCGRWRQRCRFAARRR